MKQLTIVESRDLLDNIKQKYNISTEDIQLLIQAVVTMSKGFDLMKARGKI